MTPPVEKKKKLSSTDQCLISAVTIGEHQQQSSGSFVTAFGEEKKMNNRILRKIWICSDLWMDIFPHFDHAQLGLKLALLSPRFDVLVDKHFSGKSELTIWREITIAKGFGMPKIFVNSKSVEFPWPDRPLPNKIRFKNLRIEYIDYSVLAFLHANQKNLDKNGIKLELNVFSSKKASQLFWEVFAREIWQMFAPNIRSLWLSSAGHFDDLRRLISPTILTDHNINFIHPGDLFPDTISDFDGPNATSAAQALSKWLHTPRKDGKQKELLCIGYGDQQNHERINNLKKAFLRVTNNSSVSYNIFYAMANSTPIEPFELVNVWTQEKLTLTMRGDSCCVLERCPIFEVQWKNENSNNLNKVVFYLSGDNNCIGPLSPPAEEEEAAKSNKSSPAC